MNEGPSPRTSYDAVVVGSGPNGLAAAVALSRAGLATLVVEAEDTPGGGARTKELTLPDFLHDVCSIVHPLAVASPFFRSLKLERFGLEWIHSPAPLAHVVGEGHVVLMERSVDATAQRLGRDGPAYRRLLELFANRFARRGAWEYWAAGQVVTSSRWTRPSSVLVFPPPAVI